jgi:predicted  nucleic acid-binding Zn-ribbon protein
LNGRKKLNNRELAIMASTVVGALDAQIAALMAEIKELKEEILRLRKEGRVLEKMSQIINAPLFLVASEKQPITETPSGGTQEGAEAEPASESKAALDKAENEWFVRHLTLRNVLATTVVLIGMAAGFFAWFNKDYRSLLQAKDARILEMTSEVSRALTLNASNVNVVADKEVEIKKVNSDYRSLEIRNGTLEERISVMDAEHKRILEKAMSSTTTDAKEQIKLTEEVGRANSKITGLEAELKAAKEKLQAMDKTLNGALETIRDARRDGEVARSRQAQISAQLNDAVSAWNQLVTYLASKAGKGKLEVEVDSIKQQL